MSKIKEKRVIKNSVETKSDNNYNRFGDTSFRLKNQIEFYTQLLYEIKDKEPTSLELYNLVKQKGIINYHDKAFEQSNRSKLMIKELINLSLVEEKNNYLCLTDLGENLIASIEENQNKFVDKGCNFVSVCWFLILLNKSKKLSKIFKEKVEKLFKSEIKNPDEFIKKFTLGNKQLIEASDEQLEEILEKESIKNVIKNPFRKKPKLFDTLPKFLNYFNDKKDFVGYEEELEIIKKIYRSKESSSKKKRIPIEKIKEFIISRKAKIINDYFYLIHLNNMKDYEDINKRWFLGIGLFSKQENKIILNKKYIELYKELVNYEFNDDFSKLINLINKYFQKEEKLSYPYNINQIKDMLTLLEKEKWEDLKKKYELENIANPTIYEYLINITFYLYFKKEPSEFLIHSKTNMDDNLKPITHAPGGSPDGYIECLGVRFTIESTILNRLEDVINKEYTSVQRHAVKYLETYKKETSSIFVFTLDYSDALLFKYINENNILYFEDLNKSVKIACINIKTLNKFIEKEKLEVFVKKIWNKIPFANALDPNKYKSTYNKILDEMLCE